MNESYGTATTTFNSYDGYMWTSGFRFVPEITMRVCGVKVRLSHYGSGYTDARAKLYMMGAYRPTDGTLLYAATTTLADGEFTWNFDSCKVFIPGTPWWVTFGRDNPVGSSKYWFLQGTNSTTTVDGLGTLVGAQYNAGSGNWYVRGNVEGSPWLKIIGEGEVPSASTTPESALAWVYGTSTPPAKTYSSTSTRLLPNSVTFLASTSTQEGTYAAHMNEWLDTATATFPMCMAMPWIDFLDDVEGQTYGENSQAGTLTFGGGMVPTTTLSLSSASSVAASIGFADVWNPLIRFIVAAAWMLLGFWMFWDFFGYGDEIDEDI